MGTVCAKQNAGQVTTDLPKQKLEAKQLASGGPSMGSEKRWISTGKTFATPVEDEDAKAITAEYISNNPEWKLTGKWKSEKKEGDAEPISLYEVEKLDHMAALQAKADKLANYDGPVPANDEEREAEQDAAVAQYLAKKAEEEKGEDTNAENNKLTEAVSKKLQEEVAAGRIELKEDSPVKEAPIAEDQPETENKLLAAVAAKVTGDVEAAQEEEKEGEHGHKMRDAIAAHVQENVKNA